MLLALAWAEQETGQPSQLAAFNTWWQMLSQKQPLDSGLTAIAALATTEFGRNILTMVDDAAARALIGAGTSSTSGTVTSIDGSGGSTGLTVSGGPVSGAGTLTLDGTLALAHGGTGATTPAGARAALELADDRQVIAAPVSGATYNIAASTARRIEVYFGNSGTIAAYTVVMPVLLDGQEIHFYWYGGFTSFTMTEASGQNVGSIISGAAVVANSRRSWKYNAAINRVYPKT